MTLVGVRYVALSYLAQCELPPGVCLEVTAQAGTLNVVVKLHRQTKYGWPSAGVLFEDLDDLTPEKVRNRLRKALRSLKDGTWWMLTDGRDGPREPCARPSPT